MSRHAQHKPVATVDDAELVRLVCSEPHPMLMGNRIGREINDDATVAKAIPVRDAQLQIGLVSRQDGVARERVLGPREFISKAPHVAQVE